MANTYKERVWFYHKGNQSVNHAKLTSNAKAAFLTLNRKFYPIDNSARNCRQWLENPGCLWTGQKVWELDVSSRTFQDKLHQVHVERRRRFSSLNRSRAIILSRSNCVAKFIAHRVSNTHSVISLNVTECKYREVWWLCVSKFMWHPLTLT